MQFNNICSALESHESCMQPTVGAKTHRLYVNPTTLQLYCALLTPTRFTTDDTTIDGIYEGNDCFLGGRRSQQGLC